MDMSLNMFGNIPVMFVHENTSYILVDNYNDRRQFCQVFIHVIAV